MFGMIGSIGSSMLGGMFGSNQAKKDRKLQQWMMQQNIAMQRETNQMQVEEAQKLRDWQREMYDLNNQYNSPLAQRMRLEAAGFNPYLGMGSPASASAPTGGSAPTLASPSYDVSSFSSLAASQRQNDVQSLQGFIKLGLDAFNTIRTDKRAQKDLESQIKSREFQNQNLQYQTLGKAIENQFNSRNMENALKLQSAAVEYSNLQNSMASTQLRYLQPQLQANLAQTLLQNALTRLDEMEKIATYGENRKRAQAELNNILLRNTTELLRQTGIREDNRIKFYDGLKKQWTYQSEAQYITNQAIRSAVETKIASALAYKPENITAPAWYELTRGDVDNFIKRLDEWRDVVGTGYDPSLKQTYTLLKNGWSHSMIQTFKTLERTNFNNYIDTYFNTFYYEAKDVVKSSSDTAIKFVDAVVPF